MSGLVPFTLHRQRVPASRSLQYRSECEHCAWKSRWASSAEAVRAGRRHQMDHARAAYAAPA